MKKILLNKFTLTVFASLFLFSCIKDDSLKDEDDEDDVKVNTTSIIPSSTGGKPNQKQGCIEISKRQVEIEVWDHGQIDGDIVSVVANGETIIDQVTLDGPSNKKRVTYTFDYNGFNYLTMKAHNEGDIPPNTCTISINGKEFVSSQNLQTNGAFDIVVLGYGVTCDDAGSGGGGSGGSGGSGGGGGGNTDIGDISFWTSTNFQCGPISVSLSGVGTKSLTQYFTSGSPDCGDAGTVTFSNLPYGTYNYSASCDNMSWNGTIDFHHSCYKLKFTY